MEFLPALRGHCKQYYKLHLLACSYCPHYKWIIGHRHFSLQENKHRQSLLIWQLHTRNSNHLSLATFVSSHSRYFKTSLRTKEKEDKFENLLESTERQNHISSIPVKKENIYTIPNLLSLFRLCTSPFLGYMIVHGHYDSALTLLVVAGITDVVDGQIARAWPSQQSALGTALDPLADKVLVSVLCVALTYVNIMPLPLTILFVSRDALLVAAVFYLRYRTCPPPRTIKRYFDPTLVNAKLSPTNISKVNTSLQMGLICCSVAAPSFGFVNHPALQCLWGVTALTTLASGLSYVRRRDTVRIFKAEKET